MYQEVDATLEWGTGEAYRLMDYLQYVGQQIPDVQKRRFVTATEHDNAYVESWQTILYDRLVD